MTVTYKASVLGIAKKQHPDCASGTPLAYSDTYTIDPDMFYSDDDITDYIKHDLLLVIGGGYHINTVKDYKFNIVKGL